MTFAQEPTGPNKSSRERFFDEDRVGMPNWLTDRARKLAFNVGGELEPLLTALADEWEKTLASSDLSLSNSPIVAAIARFFAEHGPDNVRAAMKHTYVGMSEEFGEDANASARGVRPVDDGHLVTMNAEMEYDLARTADLYSAYVRLTRVRHDPPGMERLAAIRLVLLCLDILGYHKPLALDAFECLAAEARASFDRQAGDFLVWGLAFIVGHELGHHMLGHTAGERPNADRRERHKMELDADGFAIKVLFESARHHPDYDRPSLGLLAGPLVALTALAVEQADPTVDGETHPSAAARWTNVLEALAAYVDEDERETILSLFGTVNSYIQGRLKLWPSEDWWQLTAPAPMP